MKKIVLVILVLLSLFAVAGCDPMTVETVVAANVSVLESANGMNFYLYACYGGKFWVMEIMSAPYTITWGEVNSGILWQTIGDLAEDGYVFSTWYALPIYIRDTVMGIVMKNAPLYEITPLIMPYYYPFTPVWESVVDQS